MTSPDNSNKVVVEKTKSHRKMSYVPRKPLYKKQQPDEDLDVIDSKDSNIISSDSGYYSEINHSYEEESFPEFTPEQQVQYDKSEDIVSPKLKS